MKTNLTLEECKKLAAQGEYGLLPVCTELLADICTPMEMLRILKKVSRHVFLLESADSEKRWGRYSFLGYDPVLELTCRNGTVKIRTPLAEKLLLIINVKTDDLETNYHRAVLELEEMKQMIRRGEKAADAPLKLKSEFHPLFDEAAYCSMVEKAKGYIREGDIFQVVLSNRLEAELEGSLLDAYRVLRIKNPSPYMFYFSGTDGEIAGASPETLVKLEQDKLYTFPLAGTRPRGRTEEEDLLLEQELLTDEKERAEHNMLVDLGRNDIGKLSRIGTVQVEKYMSVERYSHVMHLGSTVSGIIREDRDALDAVDAILPAGTLSGAPKLRACEIINELENNKRGIYGGAIGYLSFTGSLDTCIAIRLAFSRNGKVFIRSGAGIVADSVPEKEYRECIRKAAAVVEAVQAAQEGMKDDSFD